MAEEAFALSPLSASAASPTDADYHAIREAFMETARGRWFLNEYAKRNRNADTAMVLEAVARIEQSIGAAQTEDTAAPEPETLSETALAALETARSAIRAEFSEAGFDHTLLPWRKSSRIIREITWGLRESGADPRICNILDGQVRAIEAACDEFPLAVIRDRILATLDAALLQEHETTPAIAEGASSDHAAAEIMTDAAPTPAQALEAQPEAVVAEAPIAEPAVAEAVASETEVVMEAIAPEIAAPQPIASLEDIAPEATVLAEATAERIREAIAAVVDMPQPAPAPQEAVPPVAAAPRSIMTASASQPAPQPMAELRPADNEPVDEAPVVATAASLPHVGPTTDPAPESATPVLATEALAAEAPATDHSTSEDDLWADIEAEIAPLPPFDPAHENSLGASLITQGVVARPSTGRPDLLAPIRRMSHAERIAFFS
jgi:hypothetical protein